MTAADPLQVVRAALAELSDETIRGTLEVFIKGLLHGVADELAEKLVDSMTAQLYAADATIAATPEPVAEQGPRAVEPEPTPPPKLSRSTQDSVEYTCVFCGRTGSRRFEQGTGGAWQCTDRTACSRRRGIPPEEPRAAEPVAAPPPLPPKNAPTPGVTARCQDCSRTFTLTGRPLKQAAEMHELKRGHIVNIVEMLLP